MKRLRDMDSIAVFDIPVLTIPVFNYALAAAGGGADAACFTSPLRSPAWPWKVRVGANSPSLCPTMFSVQYTGMNLWPLWTAKVSAIMSGVIIERRDQVLMIRLSPLAVAELTFFSRCPSTNGPFFNDLAICLNASRAAGG